MIRETATEKVVFRRFLVIYYQVRRAFGLYLGSHVVSLPLIPIRLKRHLAALYVEKAIAEIGSRADPAVAMQAAKHAVTLCPDVSGGYDALLNKLASLYVEKAITEIGSGEDPAAAMQAAKHAVTLCPDVSGGYEALSNIMLPGENFYELLRRFHDWLRPKSYIEIGVDTGASMELAKPPTVAVGIDPEPRLFNVPKTVCKIFPLTSDDYFATYDPRRDIEAETVDLAFIDGLHLFEQALRDFINIERVSSQRTLVLIHDCFAIDALTAERERKTWFWTGDVWKIIPCLREFRPDLHVFTIATPPSGLGVVSRLDPRSTVLIDRFDEIVSRYLSLQIDPDEERRKECAVMVPNNWQGIVTRLSNQPPG